jgi:hypothetical protein
MNNDEGLMECVKTWLILLVADLFEKAYRNLFPDTMAL